MRPHRSLVLVSLPSACEVCKGHQVVAMHLAGRVPCPHCRPAEWGRLQIPIVPTSTPKGGAA